MNQKNHSSDGEWKEYKLGDVIDFGNGKVRPKSSGSIPVYGGNGILDFCDEYNYDNKTIIIGRVGAYCGSIYYEDKPVWVSDNALAAKPKKSFTAKYLFYFLKNLGLNQFAEGSSHPLVTQTLLNSIDVFITDNINEQRAIASILSSLDDKIELLHRQNKTLEQLAETLFRQWFVLEADNNLDVMKLKEIANIQNGYAFKSSDYEEYKDGYLEVLKMGHIDPNCGLRSNPKKNYVAWDKKLSKWLLNKNDIVMAMTDMKDNVVILGVPAMIDKNNKYVLNQRVARITLKKEAKLTNVFLLYVQLKDPDFIANLQSKANSGVQVNLTTEAIKECDIIVPSSEL